MPISHSKLGEKGGSVVKGRGTVHEVDREHEWDEIGETVVYAI
jgi:hypothetical protein